MKLERIPVDTTKLCVGMYVAMLDRPWLETPFVFQGFEIKDRIEIEQLQSYCSEVYVDVDKGSLTEDAIRTLMARSMRPGSNAGRLDARNTGWLRRFLAWFTTPGEGDRSDAEQATIYPIVATVRGEAPRAREAFDECVEGHAAIVEQARADGSIDLRRVREVVLPVTESVLRNPDAMAWTVFSGKRSSKRYSRAVATAVWAVMFGRHLGFPRPEIDNLAAGGLLLDIGNVDLPEDLLAAEGAMTHDEFAAMPSHVEAGLRIVRASGGVERQVLDMIACHHERFDGSGYPHGKKGSEIPVYGRIAGIVDSYDAMTTRSAYSPAIAAYDAARELNENRDRLFHAEAIRQFLQTIGMFPTGSVIELSEGSIGLVLEQNSRNPVRPKVMLVRTRDGDEFDEPRIVNMQDLPSEGKDKVWIVQGHEHGAFGVNPLGYFNQATVGQA